jgi:uncharacterized Ntn-hydrolase superfamily protein
MTFSIVAHCPLTGQLGVAVSTAVPAVGSICPYVKPGVGAVSTQAWVNPYLAIEALQRMERGEPGPAALEAVLAGDEARGLRQIGLVDARGRAASWSGALCTDWFGHLVDDHFAVQGNMLVGEATISSMAAAYRAAASRDLAERLLLAMEAGQAAGGDKRGRQSASLTVYGDEDYALLDLRVDEHPDPVAELRRIHGIARLQLTPFVAGMPRKRGPAVAPPAEVIQMLLEPPARRPGGGGRSPEPLDLVRDVLGIDLPPERLAENLAAFARILEEIGTLRKPRSHRHPSERRLRSDRALSPGAARVSLPLWAQPIEALGRRIRAKALSPVELTQACLDRIAEVDDRLLSFICLAPDALEQARRAEAEIARGDWRGPLHGIPLGIKDNYLTADMPTTAGTTAPGIAFPRRDSAAVARLRRAGAVLIGKTRTHEFAWGNVTPPVRNPWALDRVPSGSSGGSGAAVAAGLCAAAMGSDTGWIDPHAGGGLRCGGAEGHVRPREPRRDRAA